MVLDLGYGTIARLLELVPDGAVDAVIVTHQHPDHCVDLSARARVRHYRASDSPRLPLYCPPGVLHMLEALEPRPDPRTVFDVHALPGQRRIGPFRLDAGQLPHHVPNFGVRLSAPGLTVAYSGTADLRRHLPIWRATLTCSWPTRPCRDHRRRPPRGT